MIETPNTADIEHIARLMNHAKVTAHELLNVELDGSTADLTSIQRILDSGMIERESEYTLQALGVAFGMVFLNAEAGYDWWMINDEYGRDPAIRYKQSTLTFHPTTMISTRVEDREPIDMVDLYQSLRAQLQELVDAG